MTMDQAPNAPFNNADLDVLIATAIEAGSAILAIYDKPNFKVEIKNDMSPLTEADVAAEALILDRLREHFPRVPIFAEEAASTGITTEAGEAFFF